MSLENLKRRLRACELKARVDGVIFTLIDGATATIPRRQLPAALRECIFGEKTRRASIMAHAVDANDGNSLWSLAQALSKGPAEQSE